MTFRQIRRIEMRKTIEELETQAAQMLAKLGYKSGTIESYRASWGKARRWCSQRGVEWFGADEEHQLFEQLGLNENVLSPANRAVRRHIRALLSVENDGCLPGLSRPAPDDLPDRFGQVFEAYASQLEQRRLAHATRLGQVSLIRKFITGLAVEDFEDLSVEDVIAHMEACTKMTAQTKAGILYAIRAFTRWAAEEELCSPAVAAAMPVIPDHKYTSLPSAYAVVCDQLFVGRFGAGILPS
jgi:site-specific recombinase XerD